MSVLTTYADNLSRIVAAIADNAAASKVASAAATDRKTTLADELRAYATVTADDGVDTEAAAKALRLMMQEADLKKGTINGYGSSFRGFRAIIAAGEDINAFNVKAAQDFIASDDVKAMNAAKDRVSEARKGFTLADMLALADAAEAIKAAREDEQAPTASQATVAAAAL